VTRRIATATKDQEVEEGSLSSDKAANDYYQRYYDANKNKLNDARRRRYERDSAYRQKVLEWSQNYREKKRDEREPAEPRAPRFETPLEGKLRGNASIKLYSVGYVSKALGRSIQSLTHWERKGIIPPTPFKDARGFRYYTEPMIESIKSATCARRRQFPVDPRVMKRILQEWKAQGIPSPRFTFEELVENGVSKEEAKKKAILAEDRLGHALRRTKLVTP